MYAINNYPHKFQQPGPRGPAESPPNFMQPYGYGQPSNNFDYQYQIERQVCSFVLYLDSDLMTLQNAEFDQVCYNPHLDRHEKSLMLRNIMLALQMRAPIAPPVPNHLFTHTAEPGFIPLQKHLNRPLEIEAIPKAPVKRTRLFNWRKFVIPLNDLVKDPMSVKDKKVEKGTRYSLPATATTPSLKLYLHKDVGVYYIKEAGLYYDASTGKARMSSDTLEPLEDTVMSCAAKKREQKKRKSCASSETLKRKRITKPPALDLTSNGLHTRSLNSAATIQQIHELIKEYEDPESTFTEDDKKKIYKSPTKTEQEMWQSKVEAIAQQQAGKCIWFVNRCATSDEHLRVGVSKFVQAGKTVGRMNVQAIIEGSSEDLKTYSLAGLGRALFKANGMVREPDVDPDHEEYAAMLKSINTAIKDMSKWKDWILDGTQQHYVEEMKKIKKDQNTGLWIDLSMVCPVSFHSRKVPNRNIEKLNK